MSIREQRHHLRCKQFQRVQNLTVFNTAVVDKEDELFNPGVAQPCNTFRDALWRPEEGHVLPHGIIVRVDAPGEAAPVLFEIVRQELDPVVRWGTYLLA